MNHILNMNPEPTSKAAHSLRQRTKNINQGFLPSTLWQVPCLLQGSRWFWHFFDGFVSFSEQCGISGTKRTLHSKPSQKERMYEEWKNRGFWTRGSGTALIVVCRHSSNKPLALNTPFHYGQFFKQQRFFAISGYCWRGQVSCFSRILRHPELQPLKSIMH